MILKGRLYMFLILIYFYIFILYFSITRQQKFKTIGAYTESTDLMFKSFKKKYSSRDTIPFKEPADWELLARSALQRLDVDTAIRVYRHLSNISLVWSLESIKGNSKVHSSWMRSSHQGVQAPQQHLPCLEPREHQR
jgi:hypothetical protein